MSISDVAEFYTKHFFLMMMMMMMIKSTKMKLKKKTGAECPNYLSRAHLCASRDHSDPGDHGKTGQWGKVSKGPDFPASRSLAGWLGVW